MNITNKQVQAVVDSVINDFKVRLDSMPFDPNQHSSFDIYEAYIFVTKESFCDRLLPLGLLFPLGSKSYDIVSRGYDSIASYYQHFLDSKRNSPIPFDDVLDLAA